MSAAALSVLTPGTMNFQASGRGGSPSLTRAEMSVMLSGLSTAAMHYALAKYCSDAGALRLLQFHCIQVASKHAVRHSWKANKGKPCIISMGVLSAIESVNANLCFACHSPDMAGVKVCSCRSRRSGITSVDRALYVDISIRQWNDQWRVRYDYLFSYCQALDSKVQYAVRSNR